MVKESTLVKQKEKKEYNIVQTFNQYSPRVVRVQLTRAITACVSKHWATRLPNAVTGGATSLYANAITDLSNDLTPLLIRGRSQTICQNNKII